MPKMLFIDPVSNPYRYSTNQMAGFMSFILKGFQTLIGILQTYKRWKNTIHPEEFQTLIGILQTGFLWTCMERRRNVSNPYRYSTNQNTPKNDGFSPVSNPYRYSTNIIFLTSNDNREFVSNPYRYSTNFSVEGNAVGWFLAQFQTLIGILQTALFLALFKLLSSF